jgi:hypothetical protein
MMTKLTLQTLLAIIFLPHLPSAELPAKDRKLKGYVGYAKPSGPRT